MKEKKQNTALHPLGAQEPCLPAIYPRDEHCLTRANIDPDVLRIIYRLEQYHHKAYIVGGGVRDLLLLKQPKDFDLVTDATPKQIKSLFRNSRVIGRRFKLVHIFFPGGKNIELATFRDISDVFEEEILDVPLERVEKLPDQNRFGTESTDAFRRDLTINALYYDVTRSRIIDYVGGFQDLQNGVIRIIGDPHVRYQEDPVRMMRVARHAARCGFTIEEKTRKALDKNLELLLEAAPMRVFEELRKDLLSGYSAPTLHLFEETGILKFLFPELAHAEYFRLRHPFSVGLRRLDVLCREDRPPSLAGVLAFCALHSLGEQISSAPVLFGRQESLLAHLRNAYVQLSVPRKERERVSAVLHLWAQTEKTSEERRSPQKIYRRNCFAELCDFVALVDGPEGDSSLSQLLQKAQIMLGDDDTRDNPRARPRTRARPYPRQDARRKSSSVKLQDSVKLHNSTKPRRGS